MSSKKSPERLPPIECCTGLAHREAQEHTRDQTEQDNLSAQRGRRDRVALIGEVLEAGFDPEPSTDQENDEERPRPELGVEACSDGKDSDVNLKHRPKER